MISVSRTTYVPFWTFGVGRFVLSHWPDGWCFTYGRSPLRHNHILIPGIIIFFGSK